MWYNSTQSTLSSEAAVPTCEQQGQQRVGTGVGVAHVLGAAQHGVAGGGRHGTGHADLLVPVEAAALES